MKKIINGIIAAFALIFGAMAVNRARKIEKLEKEVEYEKSRANTNDFIAQKHEDRQSIETRNNQVRHASANDGDSDADIERMRNKGYLRD